MRIKKGTNINVWALIVFLCDSFLVDRLAGTEMLNNMIHAKEGIRCPAENTPVRIINFVCIYTELGIFFLLTLSLSCLFSYSYFC